MEILIRALCDHAYADDKGKLNIIGIFDNIRAEKVPATHPKMTGVLVIEGEAGEEFDYYWELKDPNQKTIFDGKNQTAKAAIGPNGKVNLIMGLSGFTAPEFGPYLAIIHVGKKKAELEFIVKPLSD